jgi:hypothetical protein
MEFCVWCQQPVYFGPWGHGNGKKLYVREKKGFHDIGAVHYYCIERFQRMKAELVAKHDRMVEITNSLSIHASSEPQETIGST